MKIYEKAIKNYAKARKEFHKQAQKTGLTAEDVFNRIVDFEMRRI